MSKFNHYTVTKEINGTVYKAQFNGISAALKAVDNCKIEGSDATSIEKWAEYILEHVIVDPKNLTTDDFSSLKELNEVIAFGRGVMQGDFRKEANEGATEKKSGK